MSNEKDYYAFISYKREDEEWAKWLQHKLEHYRLPSNLNGRTDLPKEIRPIFRDQSDLAGGVLADEINKALTNSKFLIVICSPRAARSQWVGKEVQTFIDLGRTDKIIPFIIGGTAHSHNMEDECFPLALLNLPPEQELLGVNIDEMGRDAAAVRVVAQMFGLGFDTLWQRYEREQRKKKRVVILGIVAIVLAVLVVAGWIWHQNQEIMHQYELLMKIDWKTKENQSRFIAEKAHELVEEDSYLARRLILEVLPGDLNKPDRPYTPEAEEILWETLMQNTFILRGHSCAVTSVKFSPNGKQIASASCDSTIRIWNTENGTESKTLKGHTNSVNSVSYSANGRWLVSASSDSTIRIWDVETGTVKKILSDNKECGAVRSAVFCSNEKRVVSVSYDNAVRVWDIETGLVIMCLPNLVDCNLPFAFSVDGNKIVSANKDYSLVVYSLDTTSEPLVLKKHWERITAVAISPEGDRVFSASLDHCFIVWDISSKYGNKYFMVKRGDEGIAQSVSFGQNKNNVFIATYGGIVKWDISGSFDYAMEHDILKESQGLIGCVSCSPDMELVAYTTGNVVRVTNRRNGEDEDWDAKNLLLNTVIYEENASWVDVSADGKRIVSSSTDNFVRIWDGGSGEELLELEGHTSPVNHVAFSPDGKRVVSASNDNTIRIWDSYTGDQLLLMEGHTSPVNHVAFSPDGKRVVSASNDNTVRIWDSYTGDSLSLLEGHASPVNQAFFSPDGKCVISAFSDNTIMKWDALSGKRLLLKQVNSENHILFSPDGTYYLSFEDFDNNVQIWKTEYDYCVKTLKGHTTGIRNVFFSQDGKHIVSSSDDVARIWEFPPLQDLIDQTHERFEDRRLTPEERHQYYLE